ncbi:Csu type fimbrial protein [Vulcaniibacterium tengchongense]|uniref:Spore coat protein U-like protein n=1 Tax=Vulcaniibacterium tengchongense TaxID=1273429 RepID=A0A3N4VT20_9GAMM|nr:spore coat U domain-containing protein [Vulcaniibacterium tengchongense]RPE80217.1 spore coat protein U-like protein [Vulcaniibacterium tengchongense]
MKLLKPTLLATALLAAAPAALAATQTANMNVSITIENSCTIVANPLNFGTRNTLANDIDAATTVKVTCTGQGPISIAFGTGGGAGATLASRKMSRTGGAELINYALYRDAGRTQVLGDGSASTARIAGTSTGAEQSFDVYGRVFGGQGPKPVGAYTDTVVATVEF